MGEWRSASVHVLVRTEQWDEWQTWNTEDLPEWLTVLRTWAEVDDVEVMEQSKDGWTVLSANGEVNYGLSYLDTGEYGVNLLELMRRDGLAFYASSDGKYEFGGEVLLRNLDGSEARGEQTGEDLALSHGRWERICAEHDSDVARGIAVADYFDRLNFLIWRAQRPKDPNALDPEVAAGIARVVAMDERHDLLNGGW